MRMTVARCGSIAGTGPGGAAGGASVPPVLVRAWPCACACCKEDNWRGRSELDSDFGPWPPWFALLAPCAEPGGRATFLKVMLHLTSSPAKTFWSCQRTKTRMLLEPSGAMLY